MRRMKKLKKGQPFHSINPSENLEHIILYLDIILTMQFSL